MKELFNRFLIAILVLTTIIGAILFWQKERFFPLTIKTPLSAGEITPNLAIVLEKAGLSVSGQPEVLGNSIIASVSGIRVIFGSDKELISQVRALQLVLGRLTIDKVPKEIDLRFSKMVIRY